MAYSRWRRQRRAGTSAAPIKETSGIQTGKGSTCQACLVRIQAGEPYKRLQLAKRYRVACVTCNTTPKRAKRYHPACYPTDINAAMGYNPATAHIPHTSAAPPLPPRPPTAHEAALAGLLAMETALKRRIAENPALINDAQLEATLKTYNGCKAHVLRPGADTEALVALKMSFKKVLDLVF